MDCRNLCFSVIILVCAILGSTNAKRNDGSCRKRPFAYTMADVKQCDKYWLCENGVLTPQLCPDGLVYDYTSHSCHLPQRINCKGRMSLQDPEPTEMCPRKNGRFVIDDSCDSYIECTDGEATIVNCTTNLVYDPVQAVCEFPDVANRTGCMPEEILGFTCPYAGINGHTRIPKANDCRGFYMCLESGHPRLGGCQFGLVYNPETHVCDKPEHVPGCEDYYTKKSQQ